MKSIKVLFLLSLIVIEAMSLSDRHVTTRDIKSYGQQPLLFGRRGLNPNMNSLFFGKRSPSSPVGPTVEDVRNACAVLINYLDDMERLVNEEGLLTDEVQTRTVFCNGMEFGEQHGRRVYVR